MRFARDGTGTGTADGSGTGAARGVRGGGVCGVALERRALLRRGRGTVPVALARARASPTAAALAESLARQARVLESLRSARKRRDAELERARARLDDAGAGWW